MSSEGPSPVTETSNGRGRGRGRGGRGRGRGRFNRGYGRGRTTNGVDGEREGALQSVGQSTTAQGVPTDEPVSTPVSASSTPINHTPGPSPTANGLRGQPRRKSNASRGTSGTHPPPTAPDPPKSAPMKEVPPHLAGPGLDADVLVNKVKALATHSKNSSVDSRYVPAMGLDWADEEEDPESLPDLSQWAVPKPGTVVDQMQCVKEEEPALPECPNDEAPSGGQELVADVTVATSPTPTEQPNVTEEMTHDKRQFSKPKLKRKDKREIGEPGRPAQPLTPTQEGNAKRKTLYERIYGQALPSASEQEPSTSEPPTSDKDDRPSGISPEPDSRASYPNHSSRGKGRGRGRGHAPHLAHLPFHPANVQRRQQAVTPAPAPAAQQTATLSSPRHEKPTPLPPRSQERPHTRPVIDKGALARISLSLVGPKPPTGSPRQSSAVAG